MKVVAILVGLSALSSAAVAAEGRAPLSSEKRGADDLLRNTALGVKLGMSKVSQLGDAVGTYGVYADHQLADNLLVGASLDYWSKTNGSLGGATVDISDLALGVNGKFLITNVRSAFRPYVVAGLTEHRFSATETHPVGTPAPNRLDPKYQDLNGQIGADFGGGAMYRVQAATDLMGEVRYRSTLEPGIDLGQLAFEAGLTYSL